MPQQYSKDQPDYLLLNIVCGQVSMFPNHASISTCPPTVGPDLREWADNRGLRVGDDGFSISQSGRAIDPSDFLPRRILGEYLDWFYQFLQRQSPGSMQIVEHRSRAVDISEHGNQLTVALANNQLVELDYLFMTVGQLPQPHRRKHTAGSHRLVHTPYPLPQRLAKATSAQTVAIAGLGLTAADAILSLTVGRGGKFDLGDPLQRYIPSGLEPHIIAFSLSGLPYRSRPSLGTSPAYNPVVFNRRNIDVLRRERSSRLDFDAHVLPLLFLELRIAYHRARILRDRDAQAGEDFLARVLVSASAGDLPAFLSELDTETDSFDPVSAYHGPIPTHDRDIAPLADAVSYQTWFHDWIEADLKDARLGVSGSPLKAALEICRDFRDIIRYAVDYGGLTDDSLDRFFGYHAEMINRIVVGPQKERNANISALIRSGLLMISLGPSPHVAWDSGLKKWLLKSTQLNVAHQVTADWLYQGYTDRLHLLGADPHIVGAMSRRGLLRAFRPGSEIVRAADVNRLGYPISINGLPSRRIWLIGLLCEGVTFYNSYLTSPDRFAQAQFNADRAVNDIFEEVEYDSPEAVV